MRGSRASRVPRKRLGAAFADRPTELAGVVKLPFIYLPIEISSGEAEGHECEVENAGALVRRALFLAAHKCFVVITLPSDATAVDLGVPDRADGRHVVLRTGPARDDGRLQEFLFQNAALVVGGGTAAMLRAMAHNRPVLALAPGWYSGTGAVHEVEGLDAFHSLQVDAARASARRRAVRKLLRAKGNRDSLRDSPGLLTLLRRAKLL